MNEPETTSDTRKSPSEWARDAEEMLRQIQAFTTEQWCDIFNDTMKHLELENPETTKPITLIYCRDPMIKRSWKNFFLGGKMKFFVLNKDGTMTDMFGLHGRLPVPRKHEKIPGMQYHKTIVK